MHLSLRSSFLLLIVLAALVVSPAPGDLSAAPLPPSKTPEPLRPWIDWVLYGHEVAACPVLPGADNARLCAWPARLSLDLSDRSGIFTQDWTAYSEGWVPLPGDQKVWPQGVEIDGRPSAVTPQGDRPSVRLQPGRHRVSGRFEWAALPPELRIPPATGLLSLTVRGRVVASPGRDAEGRLWLQRPAAEAEGESRIEMTVHRHVADDVPLVLTTRVDLRVSGRGREAVLGRALPDGFVPMALRAPIPVRLDPDGRLRAQVRPGRFTLELEARHDGPSSALSPPQQPPPQAGDGDWPADEVWAFEARPVLRVVTVEGVPAVDPQQTTLPEEWRQWPAYLMRQGETMRLVEKRRGDAEPAPDRLSLERVLWLDFDGGGFTIHDLVTGTMTRSWRLEMPSPATLGRVAVGGADQVVTRRAPDGPAGVEVRQGEIQIEADSRLPGPRSVVPAVGWDQDFQSVSGWLNLPPGWRLLHASGVDDINSTWTSSWTLLDLFLVLIASMAVLRMWGWRWGLLTLVALTLAWIEPGAPRWTWLLALAAAALARALPEGRLRGVAMALQALAIVTLLIVLIPFLVHQVRAAIYPALEEPRAAMHGAAGVGGFVALDEASRLESRDRLARSPAQQMRVMRSDVGRVAAKVAEEIVLAAPPAPAEDKRGYFSSSILAPDPKATVQTGPGLPNWGWRSVSLNWRGPVERDQSLRLFLVPPWLSKVLALLRVALLAALAVGLLGVRGRGAIGPLLRRLDARVVPVLVAALLLGAGSATPARSDVPPKEMLDTLRERLLAPPDCHPNCVSLPRLMLEADPTVLRLRLELHAGALAAAPLPGGADQWIPDRVVLDGQPAGGLARTPDGRLWIAIAAGTHQVLMKGRLPDRDAVQIPLPLRARRVTWRAAGWRLEGVQEEGPSEDSLQLTRLARRDRPAPGEDDRPALPPFVRVERTVEMGLQWQATTRVERLTPPGAAVIIEVPLLPGESVTTADVRVLDGKAVVSLGPDATGIAWTSSLSQADEIALAAPAAVPWVETWHLAAAPVWHVETEGIPTVFPPEGAAIRSREWRPWPGEQVLLKVTRPEAVPGQVLTFDSSALTLRPGLRATDATLDLVLRAGRGGEHTVTLPESAELLSVAIDGAAQPIRQDGRMVVLPVSPGRHEATLAWREKRGIGALFSAGDVRLGAPSVNARTTFSMPADRWTLFLGGPRLGPAVLFWSLLVVSLLASIGLGAVPWTPLRWRHWFLLSLGLTQVPVGVAMLIAGWLLVLGWRRESGAAARPLGFNTMQIVLALWTLAALSGLFWSIEQGLLGLPEMRIAGNGSTSRELQWYLDRTGEALPRPWAFSLPLLVYRLAMLAWALWLAMALLRWLRWGWGAFNEGGLWRPLRPPRQSAGAPPVVPPSAGPS